MSTTWYIMQQDPKEVEQLAASYNLNRLLAKCLLNRHIERVQKMESFLRPSSYQLPDPFLMPDMDKAVERIKIAIEKRERICIYGDYDADGVTAIAILQQGFRQLGVDAFYYIPDRYFEGAGLHSSCLRRLKEEEGVSLVITVDSGVRAFEEMRFARSIDLDVIITDHHTPDDSRPDAIAVLNPKMPNSRYPFDGLSGAGVSFKLVQALDMAFPGIIDLRNALKIAAIGTIADMVPLYGENRRLVVEGLREINREEQGPFRTLLRKVGIRGHATAMDISFKVAPRINAPGRLGDPNTAIAFFDCRDKAETHRVVDIMDGMNSVRQNLERELEQKVQQQLMLTYRRGAPPFVVAAGRHWHRGILGIMACKVLRKFNRPACVMSFDDKIAHGSIRATAGLNIIEVLHQIAPLLTSYGGHPEAAGLSLPLTNLPQFKDRMNEILREKLKIEKRRPQFHIDAELSWCDLTAKLFADLRKMAPFGTGNAMPVFLSNNLILESDLLRKGPWYHFEASDGCVSRKCSFYHPADLAFQFERFDSVDLVYSLTPFRDDYQVQIVEMRPSKS